MGDEGTVRGYVETAGDSVVSRAGSTIEEYASAPMLLVAAAFTP